MAIILDSELYFSAEIKSTISKAEKGIYMFKHRAISRNKLYAELSGESSNQACSHRAARGIFLLRPASNFRKMKQAHHFVL